SNHRTKHDYPRFEVYIHAWKGNTYSPSCRRVDSVDCPDGYFLVDCQFRNILHRKKRSRNRIHRPVKQARGEPVMLCEREPLRYVAVPKKLVCDQRHRRYMKPIGFHVRVNLTGHWRIQAVVVAGTREIKWRQQLSIRLDD